MVVVVVGSVAGVVVAVGRAHGGRRAAGRRGVGRVVLACVRIVNAIRIKADAA